MISREQDKLIKKWLSDSVLPEPDHMWVYDRFITELHEKGGGGKEERIGSSERGVPVYGFVFGDGPQTISLVGGAHADEPVGPNMLYRLVLELIQRPQVFEKLISRFRLLIIPHVNPDGDKQNAYWIRQWPDPDAFFSNVKREPPGRDIEFGYPGMRPENRAAAAFWRREGPVDLHVSLHGMAVSEGFLLLINDEWESDTRLWRKRFSQLMKCSGFLAHDHDRRGEKGFNYMGPGFTSTPKGSAMKKYFQSLGDNKTAQKFHKSSMEFHLELHPSALCMVTEFPLFLLPHSGNNGVPHHYETFRKAWKDADSEWLSCSGPETVPLHKAMHLQRLTILSALDLLDV